MPTGTDTANVDRIDMLEEDDNGDDEDDNECASSPLEDEDEEDEEEAMAGMRQCADGSMANSCAMVAGGSISRGRSTRWSSSSGARVRLSGPVYT